MGSFPHITGFLSTHLAEITLQCFLALKIPKNNPTRLGNIGSEHVTNLLQNEAGESDSHRGPIQVPGTGSDGPRCSYSSISDEEPTLTLIFLALCFSASVLVTIPQIPPGHTPPYRCTLLSPVRPPSSLVSAPALPKGPTCSKVAEVMLLSTGLLLSDIHRYHTIKDKKSFPSKAKHTNNYIMEMQMRERISFWF